MKKIYLLIQFLIFSISINAQIVTTVAGRSEVAGHLDGEAFQALFHNPHGIAIDQEGNVYTADRWSHTIRKISLDGKVTTLAGVPEQSGDRDGDAQQALFNEPWGLCVDRLGNIYVADTRNNKIRKITKEGIVSTYAGSGNFGTTDGQGSSATFGNPTGLESDANGNLYVADHLTHIIRKIDQNGNVSTLAGKSYQTGDADGMGRSASFNRPYGLTLDLNGDILVADEWNHKIRRVSPDGLVTTVAGNGMINHLDGTGNDASFNYPWDLAVDSLGNIFVADGYNYVIRKINSDKEVSTYAGTPQLTGATDGKANEATFSGATSIAFSPFSKELYIGDAYNNLVRKITDLSQAVSLTSNLDQTTICEGELLSFQAYPNAFDTYHFYINDQLAQSSSQSLLQLNDLPAGTHRIELIANGEGHSTTSKALTITVRAAQKPSVSTIGATTFFEGDSVVLMASFGQDYFWSTGETTPNITVSEAGQYYVEVQDDNGCFGTSDAIDVIVNASPTAAIIMVDGKTELCQYDTTQLLSSAPEGNQWMKDGWPMEGATSSSLQVNESGNYRVSVTHLDGTTTLSEEITISKLPELELDFQAIQTRGTTNSEFSFDIKCEHLNEITSVKWEFGDEENSTELKPSHQYQAEGLYSVALTAFHESGCKSRVRKDDYLLIDDRLGADGKEMQEVFIPNAFSPNDDGENDILYVRSREIKTMEFLVFNHWGEQIFTSTSLDAGWNGKQNNSNVQNGNYVYLVNYTNQQGEKKQLSGNVTLIR